MDRTTIVSHATNSLAKISDCFAIAGRRWMNCFWHRGHAGLHRAAVQDFLKLGFTKHDLHEVQHHSNRQNLLGKTIHRKPHPIVEMATHLAKVPLAKLIVAPALQLVQIRENFIKGMECKTSSLRLVHGNSRIIPKLMSPAGSSRLPAASASTPTNHSSPAQEYVSRAVGDFSEPTHGWLLTSSMCGYFGVYLSSDWVNRESPS